MCDEFGIQEKAAEEIIKYYTALGFQENGAADVEAAEVVEHVFAAERVKSVGEHADDAIVVSDPNQQSKRMRPTIEEDLESIMNGDAPSVWDPNT